MREHLFRGKRLNNGEWKYGYYVKQYDSHQIYVSELEGEYGFDYYHVDPETVGQYTGLTDKNGNKIFEGDILINIFGDLFVMEFPTPDEDSEDYRGKLLYPMPWREYREIIGNIYDNPELLGGNNND